MEEFDSKKSTREMKAVQYFVQIYIQDKNNDAHLRKYAMEIDRWIEYIPIDKVFEKSYEKGVFVLQTMEIYWKYANHCFDSNFWINAENALRSLKFQMEKYRKQETSISEMDLASILDSGYRGYD